MEKKEDVICVINESNGSSIISDSITFGYLLGAFWFNDYFLGNGIVLQTVLGIMFFIVAASMGCKKVKRIEGRENILKFLEEYKAKS